MEENEDRLAAFLETHEDFAFAPALGFITQSGLLTDEGKTALASSVTPDGSVRLTPDKLRADGFFIAVLERAA
jgi:16S rRNA (cytosine967-C5)-methyltransferase